MGVNIARWLDDLGLGHCAESFRGDALDRDAVHGFSAADRTDPGIRPGDRKRPLRAIATRAVDDGPGGTVQPAAAAGGDNFRGPFALPSWARAARAP